MIEQPVDGWAVGCSTTVTVIDRRGQKYSCCVLLSNCHAETLLACSLPNLNITEICVPLNFKFHCHRVITQLQLINIIIYCHTFPLLRHFPSPFTLLLSDRNGRLYLRIQGTRHNFSFYFYQPLKLQLLDITGVNDLGEWCLSHTSISMLCPLFTSFTHPITTTLHCSNNKGSQYVTLSIKTLFTHQSAKDTLTHSLYVI